jgi:hypothetical protein
MSKSGIQVGKYYELEWKAGQRIAFGVMYGFKDGKNKDVYSLMMFTKEKVFDFPVHEEVFLQWMKEGHVREISWDDALSFVL